MFNSIIDKLFNKEEDEEYVSIKSYQDEIRRIDGEIKHINKTIKFFESKRKMLEDWKKVVMIDIKKEEETECCRNCEFYNSKFCFKYDTYVNSEANCSEFIWKL